MKNSGLQILGSVAFAAALLAVPVSLPGQTGSLFGSRGPTAQPNLGGSRSGVSSLGGNIGGIGSMGTGLGTGIGTTGLGTTGIGVPMVGMQTGTGTGTGFVGRNFTAPGFVGVRQAGQTGQGFGRTGAGGLGGGGFNQFGGNQFGGNRSQRGNERNQQFGSQSQTGQLNQQPQIVVRSEIAFPYPEQAPAAVAGRLEGQLQRIASRRPEFGNLAFRLQPNGDVTLRGTVPDESARRLAAALVRLEPGVRSVNNELSVAPAR